MYCSWGMFKGMPSIIAGVKKIRSILYKRNLDLDEKNPNIQRQQIKSETKSFMETSYFKMSILSKSVYKINATPTKITTEFFVALDKLIIKCFTRAEAHK